MEELMTLVERARRGDHQAYALLVQRFQDIAVGYCYAKVGDLTVAEDLAQEAFLKGHMPPAPQKMKISTAKHTKSAKGRVRFFFV